MLAGILAIFASIGTAVSATVRKLAPSIWPRSTRWGRT